jgi:hypothetical protein
MSSEPVSWLMIEPGWTVCASDGAEVGHVAEVAGDSNMDVFHGLAVSMRMLGKPRYVAAEHVGTIVEGRVNLLITGDELRTHGDYEEPPPSAVIQPQSAYAAEPVAPPPSAGDRQVPMLRRLAAWLRSRRSR